MTTIKVLIADDHAVLRSGLRLLLNGQPDIKVIGEAEDCNATLKQAAQLQPDVAILDLTMPGGNAIELISRLQQASPQTRVVVLTMHHEPTLARAALAAGARGFVVKSAADVELITAVRSVARGRLFVDIDLPSGELERFFDDSGSRNGKGAKNRRGRLSVREQDVLNLLAEGHTNQEIAKRLDVSVKTIETYRARIGEKLGLRSRADYIRFAVETGLLGPGKFSATS